MLSHIKNAFFYSLAGLVAVCKEEMAFRLVLIQAVFVLFFIFAFPLQYFQQALLVYSAFLCLIIELLNSAIENAVDLVTREWHELAKKAKDMGSAAQLLASASLYVQIGLVVYQTF